MYRLKLAVSLHLCMVFCCGCRNSNKSQKYSIVRPTATLNFSIERDIANDVPDSVDWIIARNRDLFVSDGRTTLYIDLRNAELPARKLNKIDDKMTNVSIEGNASLSDSFGLAVKSVLFLGPIVEHYRFEHNSQTTKPTRPLLFHGNLNGLGGISGSVEQN